MGAKRFQDRKSTRLNSSHGYISYAVFCLKKKHTWFISLLTVDRMPDAIGRRRHFEFVVADRIGDRVDHRSRCADRAGLAAALDAERIARTQRRSVTQLERRQVVGPRHGVVHERRRDGLAAAVIDSAFKQRLADALGEAAMDLAFDDHRV